MAYPYGGYPPGYMPGYYTPGAAMPDQLAQLRAAQQPVNMQPQAAGQQNGNGILWVQGEAGAKSYMVAPGNSVLLMDSERSAFYIKTADASGMPALRTFEYVERSGAPQQAVQPPAQQNVEFVTRAEFEALAARIDGLTAPKDTPRPKRAAKEDTSNAESAV